MRDTPVAEGGSIGWRHSARPHCFDRHDVFRVTRRPDVEGLSKGRRGDVGEHFLKARVPHYPGAAAAAAFQDRT